MIDALLICGFLPSDLIAESKEHGVPRILKTGGLPPDIAKKYEVGQRLPSGTYVLAERTYGTRLPYSSPAGREWVRAGGGVSLQTAAMGKIVDAA